MLSDALTLTRKERIRSKLLTEKLFGGGSSRSIVAFPLRVVYMEKEREDGDAPVQILVSVPKRYLKHAVDRNRVKRQIREAYRHKKSLLLRHYEERKHQSLAIAFIWLDSKKYDTMTINLRMRNLLERIVERL